MRLLDAVSAVMLFFAVRAAMKPADEEHTYGHEKFETIGGLIGGIVLIAVAFTDFLRSCSTPHKSPATYTGDRICRFHRHRLRSFRCFTKSYCFQKIPACSKHIHEGRILRCNFRFKLNTYCALRLWISHIGFYWRRRFCLNLPWSHA